MAGVSLFSTPPAGLWGGVLKRMTWLPYGLWGEIRGQQPLGRARKPASCVLETVVSDSMKTATDKETNGHGRAPVNFIYKSWQQAGMQ